MTRHNAVLRLAACSVVALWAQPARAQSISLKDLSTQLASKVEAKFEKERKGTEEVDKVEIKDVRITGLRVPNVPPPAMVWLSDELRPYVNCGVAAKSFTQTITSTTSDQITFEQSFHITATVTVEASVQTGVVGGSLSAGVEAGMERGETRYSGKDVSVEQVWNETLEPHSGVWLGPLGQMRSFTKQPFEVDVAVTKVKVRFNPKGKQGNTWADRDWSKNPLLATAAGTFSAVMPASSFGLGTLPMTADEYNASCGSPTRQGATQGVAAGTGKSATKAPRQVVRGSAVPAAVKVSLKHP